MNFLDIVPIVGKVLDRLIPDPQAKASAQMELLKLQQAGDFKELEAELQTALAQSEVNKVEAASTNWLVAGWRPYIGWVCGTGLLYQFLIYPILVAYQPKAAQLDMGTLVTLLGGMLGLSGMRTYEKTKGAEGNR